ncbi:MAG: EAL domain-containing protein [Campylobacterales bacterium]|nr:EAL domain-containing protein [Campylobacterales bacterium]
MFIALDRDANITLFNKKASEILETPIEEALGKNWFETFLPKNDIDNLKSIFKQLISGDIENVEHFQNDVVTKKGDTKIIQWHNSLLYVADGDVCGTLSSGEDITKQHLQEMHLKESLDSLDKQINYDTLTGLPNRTLFEYRLKNALIRCNRYSGKFAVILIDIDHFKEINDSFTHDFGDIAIKEFSKWISKSTRLEDTVARFSGDAFIILLEEINDDLAPVRLLESLKRIVDNSYLQIKDHKLHLTFSAGIALYPDDGIDSAMIVKNADAAMYAAKDAGRNTYRYYTNEMTELAFERVMIQSNLRNALKKREFELFYQPQYDVREDKLIGMEALIRWHHSKMGTVLPYRFIHILESSNLMIDVGEWILQTAFKQCVKWHEDGFEPGVVSVNLAMVQLKSGDELVSAIKKLLSKTRCKAEWIGLEITESGAMENDIVVIETLQKLSDIGFIISIDDFGTGYSSLSYLSKLPLNKLKIDKSFIDNVLENKNDATLTKAIIAMAKNLNLEVIAEGVELEAQKEFLLSNGCYEIQGYLYAKPMRECDISKMLKYNI